MRVSFVVDNTQHSTHDLSCCFSTRNFHSQSLSTLYFINNTAVVGEGYRTLEEGMQVEFHVGPGQRGPSACDVTRLD
jgi:hypothetical protein